MRAALLLVAVIMTMPLHATTVADAKRLVASGLKDPASVQFRNVQAYKATGAVCGEYNAKNAFGGYVGFTAFGIDRDGNAMDAPNTKELNASYAEAAMRQFRLVCAGT